MQCVKNILNTLCIYLLFFHITLICKRGIPKKLYILGFHKQRVYCVPPSSKVYCFHEYHTYLCMHIGKRRYYIPFSMAEKSRRAKNCQYKPKGDHMANTPVNGVNPILLYIRRLLEPGMLKKREWKRVQRRQQIPARWINRIMLMQLPPIHYLCACVFVWVHFCYPVGYC